MSKHYRDYIWKEGIPYGIEAIDRSTSLTYKIPMDPYRKRIAVEKYLDGHFDSVIYDSAFLDFRHLKPAEQTAWQKVIVSENEQNVVAAIYNQDDRLILFETYFFEKKLCRSCLSTSGHGIPLSNQKLFYTNLGDLFNGVILFDNNAHPVTLKRYEVDGDSGEFGELIEEIWDGGKIQLPSQKLER